MTDVPLTLQCDSVCLMSWLEKSVAVDVAAEPVVVSVAAAVAVARCTTVSTTSCGMPVTPSKSSVPVRDMGQQSVVSLLAVALVQDAALYRYALLFRGSEYLLVSVLYTTGRAIELAHRHHSLIHPGTCHHAQRHEERGLLMKG